MVRPWRTKLMSSLRASSGDRFLSNWTPVSVVVQRGLGRSIPTLAYVLTWQALSLP